MKFQTYENVYYGMQFDTPVQFSQCKWENQVLHLEQKLKGDNLYWWIDDAYIEIPLDHILFSNRCILISQVIFSKIPETGTTFDVGFTQDLGFYSQTVGLYLMPSLLRLLVYTGFCVDTGATFDIQFMQDFGLFRVLSTDYATFDIQLKNDLTSFRVLF